MLTTLLCAGLCGIDGFLVTVECDAQERMGMSKAAANIHVQVFVWIKGFQLIWVNGMESYCWIIW